MRIILVLLSLIMSTATFAADCPATQRALLENFADTAMQNTGKPGDITAIAMVAQHGNATPISVYQGVNGLNDPTAINADSIFQIGSITKSFIAVVVLQLAAEKGFNLDDPSILAKYFPEYPNWHGITLRELMNMTSGIPGNETGLPDDIFTHFTRAQYTHYISPIEILNLTYAYPLHFKPGADYEYSNTNYTLLGVFIRRLTQHTAEQEVQTRIIHKLGLKNTYFPLDTEAKAPGIKTSQIVHGYNDTPMSSRPYPFERFGEDITDFSLSEYNTQGAIISTPADINRYIHALYNPGPLLNQAQIQQLTTLISRVNGSPFNPNNNLGNPLGYGLGIIGYYWQNHYIYLYNGQTDGFNFVYLIDPKTQQYLTLAVNNQGYGLIEFPKVLDLFSQITSCYLAK